METGKETGSSFGMTPPGSSSYLLACPSPHRRNGQDPTPILGTEVMGPQRGSPSLASAGLFPQPGASGWDRVPQDPVNLTRKSLPSASFQLWLAAQAAALCPPRAVAGGRMLPSIQTQPPEASSPTKDRWTDGC